MHDGGTRVSGARYWEDDEGRVWTSGTEAAAYVRENYVKAPATGGCRATLYIEN